MKSSGDNVGNRPSRAPIRAMIECSDSEEEPGEEADKRRRNKKVLVQECGVYGYRLPNGHLMKKTNFVMSVSSEITSKGYPDLIGHTWSIDLAPSMKWPEGSLQEVFLAASRLRDVKTSAAMLRPQVLRKLASAFC